MKTLREYGIDSEHVLWNATPHDLVKESIDNGMGALTNDGVLSIHTGKFTGRSPRDRFIVKDEVTQDRVWWGKANIPFDSEKFDALYDKVTAYLSAKKLYARDVFACSDPKYRLNIRAINEYPWSNLFVSNMFRTPKSEELEGFEPDWIIVNAPGFLGDPSVDGVRASNFAILNFRRRIALIGGTGYTGEMKKGIFSALNFILPTQHKVLSMHCSANVGSTGDTAIFFGLSGTGKTTLSADRQRKLIGDDEHGWSHDNTIFNFEGGCYAKTIGLSKDKEPFIYDAIKPGALLENVVFKPGTQEVDFDSDRITENTRVSYPLSHIQNIQPESMGRRPENIFFLTADAFGILPPVSKLTPGQAAYHFISGYTAKVAGTEAGISEPTPSFSACFGAPFMLLHPAQYAEMLIEKMRNNKVNVWMINTGWSGGGYGVGARIKLAYTRAMITAVLEGMLDTVPYEKSPVFNFSIPLSCPGVPSEILNPRNVWEDKALYDTNLQELAKSFVENFEKFKAGSSSEILEGGPLT